MSAAAAGLGSVLGTSMVSMRSIGLASSSSCRTAHLQNEATAARLRLRVAGACSAISARNARTGAAVVVGGERDQVAAVGADRVARLVRVRQVGEVVVDVAGERVAVQRVAGGLL